MNHAVFVLLLVAVTGASAVKFTDCGSTVQGLKLDVSNCGPADDVCPFYIGENITMAADFTAVGEIASAKVKLAGKLGPISVPFKIDPDEACGNYGLACPVKPGQPGSVKISLPIKSSYKPVKVGVRFELWNGDSKLICTQFPAQLKNRQ